MPQGRIRHLFPGGNTALGFFSYYDQIITQEDADRIMIIKGGPGVGKSTFMKRVGREMRDRGYDVEYLHCSSDPGSLDGLVIPALKTAFIDGTSPHVVDPKSPGAVDEILNFGAYWNEAGIRAHKDEIIKTNREIGYIFQRAYRYLKAAHGIYEGGAAIHAQAMDTGRINRLAADLVAEILDGAAAGKAGRERRMFASALTPEGYCHYLDTVLTTGRVYAFDGGLGTGEDRVITRIREAAVERGYDVEGYYCALNPYKIEHLVIPDLDVALTTANRYHSAGVKRHMTVDMREYMDQAVMAHFQDDLMQSQADVDRLLDATLATIYRAKALHDELETYYVPNIRFGEIDRLYEETVARILH